MAKRIMYFIYGCAWYLLFAGATGAYGKLAIQFEERNPRHEPGLAQEEYRQRVPMLIPGSVGALPAPTSTQEAAMP